MDEPNKRMEQKNSALQIYCRLRPEIPKSSNSTVETDLPSTKNKPKDWKMITVNQNSITLRNPFTLKAQTFIFDHVFDQSCGQETIFDFMGRPVLDGTLLQGQDALLFAYGLTSSGKSFTINGTPEHPGVIPRSIAYIFNVLAKAKINRKNQILSDGLNGFIYNNLLDPQDQDQPQPEFAEEFFFLDPSNRKKFPRILSEWSQADIRFNEDSLANISADRHYSLFISFVEIYNNYIYDLLEVQNPKSMKWDRCPLQLVNDNNQMVYVYGSREVEVSNLDEAFKVFLFGLQNRRMAQTKMNDTSSRSHSVFTIKLVHFVGNQQQQQQMDSKRLPTLKVNQVSIVDLAGLERANRTGNTGAKLYEASNINNSLMALRLCFDSFQKNMSSKKKSTMIPYRSSKLTYLLKRFFEFRSQIRMIICLKPDMDDYDENYQVLNFGRKAQQIIIEQFQNHGTNDHVDEDLNDGNDSKDDPDFPEFNVLELDPLIFDDEPFKTGNSFKLMIVAISDYLKNYETNLNKIFSNAQIILDNLDRSLEKFPETTFDRESLKLQIHRVSFSRVASALESLQRFHPASHLAPIGHLANTPIIYLDDRLSENTNRTANKMRSILQEFNRELPVWENESVELENKFLALLASCNRYIDRTFASTAYKLPLKQMDVFNRLYYQSPARYKLNQSLNRNRINQRDQRGLMATPSLLLSSSSTKTNPTNNNNNKNHSIIQPWQQKINSNQQRKMMECRNTVSAASAAVVDCHAVVDSTPKTVKKLMYPGKTTTTTTVKTKTPMSEKIEMLCKKYESLSAKNSSSATTTIAKRKLCPSTLKSNKIIGHLHHQTDSAASDVVVDVDVDGGGEQQQQHQQQQQETRRITKRRLLLFK